MCQPVSHIIPILLSLPWYPYVCSLCLCLFFCFVNKIIYTYFSRTHIHVLIYGLCFSLSDFIPLLGIHIKETRTDKDTCTPMFIAALFTIARTWKQPRCPLANKWIRKLWYKYTMGYNTATKKYVSYICTPNIHYGTVYNSQDMEAI